MNPYIQVAIRISADSAYVKKISFQIIRRSGIRRSQPGRAPYFLPRARSRRPGVLGRRRSDGGSGWRVFLGRRGVFERIKGVKKVVSGFAGGDKSTAHYETVSTGRTGHAESVQVTFDPSKITYGQLLMVYFSVAHDPTELNHQGPDTGTQYRSAIFYNSDEQKKVAAAYIKQLDDAKVFSKTDCHPGAAAQRLLSGRSVSSAFPGQQHDVSVHRLQRSSEASSAEETISAAVPALKYGDERSRATTRPLTESLPAPLRSSPRGQTHQSTARTA